MTAHNEDWKFEAEPSCPWYSIGVKSTENNTFCAQVWRLSDLHSGLVIAQSVPDQRSSINRSYSSSSWERRKKRILVQAVYQRLRVQIRLKHNRAAADVDAMHLQIHYHPLTRRQRFQSCVYITWKFSSLTCLPRKQQWQGGERLLHAYVGEGACSLQKTSEMQVTGLLKIVVEWNIEKE